MTASTRAAATCAILATALLAACAANKSAESNAPQSAWIHPGPDGKLLYQTTDRGDRILDFSYAGYMGGGVTLPDVPTKKTLHPLGEGKDDTASIQAALDEIATLPLVNGSRGALLLAPGTFNCSAPITITASGVVLRGTAPTGPNATTLNLTGQPHGAIRAGNARRRNRDTAPPDASTSPSTLLADTYLPSGSSTFSVKNSAAFAPGDWISIQRPVTADWIQFMHMDDMTRDGKPQTWIKEGSTTDALRQILAIHNNQITIDVPLSDSFDQKYAPDTRIIKVPPPQLLSQIGIEHLHIQSPPQQQNHTQAHFQAIGLVGEDCWIRDVLCDETMNSVSIGGRRITLQRVAVIRKFPHLGASKPAEFAPNGTQVLLDRCTVSADNVWFAASGAGVSGPVVLLNCTFRGQGAAESHQRWSTGLLYDNVRAPEGELEMRNRGEMGSGHGWGMGWGVMWNCDAKNYIVQNPPGATNWMIGCIGKSQLSPRPFGNGPLLPEGTIDSPNTPVRPASLYLAQLKQRLGPQALANLGYNPAGEITANDLPITTAPSAKPKIDRTLGENLALHRPVGTSSARDNNPQFFGDMALDANPATFWATNPGTTTGTLELDMEGAATLNAAAIEEGPNCRILEYKIDGMINGDWKELSHGTAVGERKLDHFPPTTVWKVRLTITKSEGCVAIREFSLYHQL